MPRWVGLVCLFHFHQLNYERGQDLVDTFGDLSLNSSADGDDVPTKHDPSEWLNGQSRYVRRSDHNQNLYSGTPMKSPGSGRQASAVAGTT